MTRSLRVHLLPQHVAPAELQARTAVVIDVLRATTTMITALAEGAAGVWPCREVADARLLAARQGDCLLGGERGGLPIDGFDLGNSPREYTADVVAGKSIILTTTNGTRALDHCRQADRILVAGFVNLASVCRQLDGVTAMDIVCAGTDGQVTLEDVLLAGAIVDRLQQAGRQPIDCDDVARLSASAWRETEARGKPSLADSLLGSLGGKNLAGINMSDDVTFAADVDRFAVAAELDRQAWAIRLR